MKKTLLLFLAGLLLLTACGRADSDLARSRELWDEQGISHYRFRLHIGCFCAFRSQMPLTIEVKDGRVVQVSAADGSDIANFDEFYSRHDTISELFELVEQAADEADEVSVSYNARYGYPEAIAIDYIKAAVDDEIAYEITDFEVLP